MPPQTSGYSGGPTCQRAAPASKDAARCVVLLEQGGQTLHISSNNLVYLCLVASMVSYASKAFVSLPTCAEQFRATKAAHAAIVKKASPAASRTNFPALYIWKVGIALTPHS